MSGSKQVINAIAISSADLAVDIRAILFQLVNETINTDSGFRWHKNFPEYNTELRISEFAVVELLVLAANEPILVFVDVKKIISDPEREFDLLPQVLKDYLDNMHRQGKHPSIYLVPMYAGIVNLDEDLFLKNLKIFQSKLKGKITCESKIAIGDHSKFKLLLSSIVGGVLLLDTCVRKMPETQKAPETQKVSESQKTPEAFSTTIVRSEPQHTSPVENKSNKGIVIGSITAVCVLSGIALGVYLGIMLNLKVTLCIYAGLGVFAVGCFLNALTLLLFDWFDKNKSLTNANQMHTETSLQNHNFSLKTASTITEEPYQKPESTMIASIKTTPAAALNFYN
jgi:hypothetical protein